MAKAVWTSCEPLLENLRTAFLPWPEPPVFPGSGADSLPSSPHSLWAALRESAAPRAGPKRFMVNGFYRLPFRDKSVHKLWVIHLSRFPYRHNNESPLSKI